MNKFFEFGYPFLGPEFESSEARALEWFEEAWRLGCHDDGVVQISQLTRTLETRALLGLDLHLSSY